MEEDVEYSAFIDLFPDYVITTWGRVFNRFGHEMVLSPTLNGELTVGLTKDGRQYRRSMQRLIAKTFVPGENGIFNTPCLLNGDQTDLRAANIVWRPKWFTNRYRLQFIEPEHWYLHGPITDVTNDIDYDTIIDASVANGSLCEDIRNSLETGLPVFPHGDVYKII